MLFADQCHVYASSLFTRAIWSPANRKETSRQATPCWYYFDEKPDILFGVTPMRSCYTSLLSLLILASIFCRSCIGPSTALRTLLVVVGEND